MHPQERIDDAPVLPGRHARRARGVVQRLDPRPHRVRDRIIVERMERVVERRVVRAGVRERLAEPARERADDRVVCAGEVV